MDQNIEATQAATPESPVTTPPTVEAPVISTPDTNITTPPPSDKTSTRRQALLTGVFAAVPLTVAGTAVGALATSPSTEETILHPDKKGWFQNFLTWLGGDNKATNPETAPILNTPAPTVEAPTPVIVNTPVPVPEAQATQQAAAVAPVGVNGQSLIQKMTSGR